MTVILPVRINFKSGKAAYLQIVEQVQAAVAGGTLLAEDQLPSIRDLAEQLRLNRNTVARAYTELEHLGVVRVQQGVGVFVARPAAAAGKLTKSAREALAYETIDAAIVQARHLGMGDEEFLRLVTERLKKFITGKGEEK